MFNTWSLSWLLLLRAEPPLLTLHQVTRQVLPLPVLPCQTFLSSLPTGVWPWKLWASSSLLSLSAQIPCPLSADLALLMAPNGIPPPPPPGPYLCTHFLWHLPHSACHGGVWTPVLDSHWAGSPECSFQAIFTGSCSAPGRSLCVCKCSLWIECNYNKQSNTYWRC